MLLVLVGCASATLEGAIVGFGKDMGMTVLSQQSPELGRVISFAMNPQGAVTSEMMGFVNQVSPEAGQLLSIGMDPQGEALSIAKKKIMTEIRKDLKPDDQRILDNVEKVAPYIEKTFEENPEAPVEEQKGKIEIDEKGEMIVKDPKGEVYSKIPKGYTVEEEEGKLKLRNRDSDSEQVVEIRGYKFKLPRGSEVSFSEEEGVQTIDLKGVGDVVIGDKEINSIRDGTIRLNQENLIEFAEFTSDRGGEYVFEHNEKSFKFNAKEGGKVLFDPKEKKVEGENTEIEYEGKKIESESFQGFLGDDGNLERIELIGDSVYTDSNGNVINSKEKTSLFLDGTDIKDFEGNAVSIQENEEGIQINGKGKVNIVSKEGLVYEGLGEKTYVEFKTWKKDFDISGGDASLTNGKHFVLIKNGKPLLSSKNLKGLEFAEDFSFSYTDGDKKIRASLFETAGHLEIISYVDGKKNRVNLVPLDNYDNPPSREVMIQKNIEEAKSALKLLKNSGGSKDKIDGLELAIVSAENMQDESNYDAAINRLGKYLETERDPESKALAEYSLAEAYAVKAKAAVSVPIAGLVKLKIYDTTTEFPIWEDMYFKTELVGGKEVVVGYSRDGKNYVSLTEARDSGSVTRKEFITSLLRQGGDIEVLKTRGGKYDSELSGPFISDWQQYDAMMRNYDKSKELFSSVRKYASDNNNVKLFEETTMSLALLEGESGDVEKQIWYYRDMGNSGVSTELKTRGYMAAAVVERQRGNIVQSLRDLENARRFAPDDDNLEKLYIETFSKTADTVSFGLMRQEYDQFKMYNAKMESKGFFSLNSFVYGGAGEDSKLNVKLEGNSYEINEQQSGILALKSLARKGTNLDEYVNAPMDEQKRFMISEAMGLKYIDDDEIAEAYVDIKGKSIVGVSQSDREKFIREWKGGKEGVLYANDDGISRHFLRSVDISLGNHDIALLVANGNAAKAKNILEKYNPGLSVDDIDSDFWFKNGKNYVNPEDLENKWYDTLMKEVNAVNAGLILVPMSTVTIAGKTMTVAGQVGRGLKNVRGISGVIEGGSAIKASIGSARSIAWMSEKMPTLSKVGAFVFEEVGEEGLAIVTGSNALGIVSAHARVFDIGEAIAKKSVKPIGSRVLITETGEAIHGLEFKDKTQMAEFLIEARKNNDIVELTDVGENIFASKRNSDVLIPYVKGDIPTSIGVRQIKIIDDLPPQELFELSEGQLDHMAGGMGFVSDEAARRAAEYRDIGLRNQIRRYADQYQSAISASDVSLNGKVEAAKTLLTAKGVKFKVEGNKIIISTDSVNTPYNRFAKYLDEKLGVKTVVDVEKIAGEPSLGGSYSSSTKTIHLADIKDDNMIDAVRSIADEVPSLRHEVLHAYIDDISQQGVDHAFSFSFHPKGKGKILEEAAVSRGVTSEYFRDSGGYFAGHEMVGQLYSATQEGTKMLRAQRVLERYLAEKAAGELSDSTIRATARELGVLEKSGRRLTNYLDEVEIQSRGAVMFIDQARDIVDKVKTTDLYVSGKYMALDVPRKYMALDVPSGGVYVNPGNYKSARGVDYEFIKVHVPESEKFPYGTFDVQVSDPILVGKIRAGTLTKEEFIGVLEGGIKERMDTLYKVAGEHYKIVDGTRPHVEQLGVAIKGFDSGGGTGHIEDAVEQMKAINSNLKADNFWRLVKEGLPEKYAAQLSGRGIGLTQNFKSLPDYVSSDYGVVRTVEGGSGDGGGVAASIVAPNPVLSGQYSSSFSRALKGDLNSVSEHTVLFEHRIDLEGQNSVIRFTRGKDTDAVGVTDDYGVLHTFNRHVLVDPGNSRVSRGHEAGLFLEKVLDPNNPGQDIFVVMNREDIADKISAAIESKAINPERSTGTIKIIEHENTRVVLEKVGEGEFVFVAAYPINNPYKGQGLSESKWDKIRLGSYEDPVEVIVEGVKRIQVIPKFILVLIQSHKNLIQIFLVVVK